ncbi:MAG TPA: XdhC family protein, partial [Pyrinomonadaceae bacterium]
SFDRSSETDFIYQEKLGPKNKLIVIGGGHCALALSELMSRMDFTVRIFDDRPELNTLAKNRYADAITIIDSYGSIADRVDSGDNVYVVVMTLGYKTDAVVIRRLVDRQFKYFGVLGSRAKMATLLKELQSEGYPQAQLDAIRTPIGLQINSHTPEEIAVSIAAEIISVKNS